MDDNLRDDELEALRAFRTPPEPPIDAIWTAVAARTRAERRRARMWRLAAAAAVLAAVVPGAFWWNESTGRDGAAGSGGAPAQGASDPTATREMEQQLEGGLRNLPPVTAGALRASIASINAALAEVDAALAGRPTSDVLLDLQREYRSQYLTLLAEVAAASTEWTQSGVEGP